MPSWTHENWTRFVASYFLWTLEGSEWGKVPKPCKQEQGARVRGMLCTVQMEQLQHHQLWQRIRGTSRGVREAGALSHRRPPFSFCNETANDAAPSCRTRDPDSRQRMDNFSVTHPSVFCVVTKQRERFYSCASLLGALVHHFEQWTWTFKRADTNLGKLLSRIRILLQ